MLKFGNKEFRNLEEQVAKNQGDIEDIRDSGKTLASFGITIVGQIADASSLPSEYSGDYGDAYIVGDDSDPDKYEYYVWTRGGDEADRFVNIGHITQTGPTGPAGPALTVGDVRTQTLPAGYSAVVNIFKSADNKLTFHFALPQGAKGSAGEVGPTGPQGIQGPKGDKGDKGDQGEIGPTAPLFHIVGIVETASSLPLPSAIGDLTVAYLVVDSENRDYDLYIQVGGSAATAQWTNIGHTSHTINWWERTEDDILAPDEGVEEVQIKHLRVLNELNADTIQSNGGGSFGITVSSPATFQKTVNVSDQVYFKNISGNSVLASTGYFTGNIKAKTWYMDADIGDSSAVWTSDGGLLINVNDYTGATAKPITVNASGIDAKCPLSAESIVAGTVDVSDGLHIGNGLTIDGTTVSHNIQPYIDGMCSVGSESAYMAHSYQYWAHACSLDVGGKSTYDTTWFPVSGYGVAYADNKLYLNSKTGEYNLFRSDISQSCNIYTPKATVHLTIPSVDTADILTTGNLYHHRIHAPLTPSGESMFICFDIWSGTKSYNTTTILKMIANNPINWYFYDVKDPLKHPYAYSEIGSETIHLVYGGIVIDILASTATWTDTVLSGE